LRALAVILRTPSTGSDDTQLGGGWDASDGLERQLRQAGETVGTLRRDWGIWKVC
jgi:hypothetical protein